MKMIKFLTSRMFVTIALIAVQAVWVILFWLYLSQYSPLVSIFFTILSLFSVLYVVLKDENPTFKIGWIIIIMLVPLLGGLLYIFFGNKRPVKKISKKILEQHNQYRKYQLPNQDVVEKVFAQDERIAGSLSYLQDNCGFPAWENTQTTYYSIGEEMYTDMLYELEKAEHFIFLEYFILAKGEMWDGVLKILKKKVAKGLDVRLIYDDVGCLGLLPRNFSKEMEQQGIKCMTFNPFVPFLSLAMNNRDHRKILVIDGHTAFSGGINIADEYINTKEKYGHWKDSGIKLIGSGVWSFTVLFLEMWNAFRKTDEDIQKFAITPHHAQFFENDGVVIPFGDSPLDEEAIGQNIYLDILNQAKRYVYIFTPYLIVDDEMQNALRFAAKRGVDVRLILPGIPDKKIPYRMARSYYQILLLSGVRIYEYTPGFIHAKSFVSDDEIAVVGTINMDFRSLYLHFECGTYLYQNSSIVQIKEDFLQTLELSAEVAPKNKTRFNLIDAVIRVFAPLM